MSYDFNTFEKDPINRPRDKAWSNWAKFNKEGDKIQGYIRDVFYRKGEGEFAAQRGITLEQPDGEYVNVGVKRISFVLALTDDFRLGDPLTIVFEKTLAPRQKGYKGVKQFGFYGQKLEENKASKTVRELDTEDMNAQGLTEPTSGVDELDQTAEELKAGATA